MSLAVSRDQLERLLRDDAPYGDLTSESLGLLTRPAKMIFCARGKMVAALTAEAAEILRLAGARADQRASDGEILAPGAEILSAEGEAGALLRGWKVAQTLIEIWSGVATATRKIVDEAQGVAVACTRKNSPGTKNFAVAAVKAGGAVMHRLGLSETILVFPEHRALLSGQSLPQIAAQLRQKAPEKKLVIEVKTVLDGVEAAEAGFDVIQAEKFSPEKLAELVAATKTLTKPPLIAAAGGVKGDNARAYVAAGAGLLVSSAPYYAPPCDVSVQIVAI